MALQGVTTTGIYCRAECGARPRPQHVRPLRGPYDALAQGFRPCLQCRPDRLPDRGPDGASSAVRHALRLIADGFLDTASTDALAARVGYGRRHLDRLFADEVGASPDFVARARRAHLARRLLDETDLSVTEIAFAAGFASLRTMNRVVGELFGFSPTVLRAKRRVADPLAAVDGGLRLRVPYDGPLDAARMIEYLGARAIPGVEAVADGRYWRTIRTCGHPGVAEVAPASSAHLDVTLHLASFGAIADVLEGLRGLFGLRRDQAAAERALGRDALLGSLVRQRPGLRLPGAYDRFETAVRIVVGQQVSVAGASTVTGRLAARFGESIDAPLPHGLGSLFPGPAALAEADEGVFDMPRARARTLVGFARAVADGDLDLTRVAPQGELCAALEALPGVGPWTAHLVAARAHDDPDAFPASDLGLRRSVARIAGADAPPSARELEHTAERWRPFRTTAAAYLWMGEPAGVAARV